MTVRTNDLGWHCIGWWWTCSLSSGWGSSSLCLCYSCKACDSPSSNSIISIERLSICLIEFWNLWLQNWLWLLRCRWREGGWGVVQQLRVTSAHHLLSLCLFTVPGSTWPRRWTSFGRAWGERSPPMCPRPADPTSGRLTRRPCERANATLLFGWARPISSYDASSVLMKSQLLFFHEKKQVKTSILLSLVPSFRYQCVCVCVLLETEND